MSTARSPTRAIAMRNSPSRPNGAPSIMPLQRPSELVVFRAVVDARSSPAFFDFGAVTVVSVFSALGASCEASAAGFSSESHVALIDESFGSSERRKSFASGFGVAVDVSTVNVPAAKSGVSGSAIAVTPAMKRPSNFVSAANGSPAATMMLASLPVESVPTRASRPSIFAGVVVTAASASSGVSPCVIASASFFRNDDLSLMRCDVIATFAPAATKRFGFVGA